MKAHEFGELQKFGSKVLTLKLPKMNANSDEPLNWVKTTTMDIGECTDTVEC